MSVIPTCGPRSREWTATLLVAALLYAIARRALIVATVEGRSMMPTLHAGQRLIVDRLAHRVRPLRRGAILVITPLDARQPPAIKRLIGLPGERIAIHAGGVSINGVALEEPYLIERPPPVPQASDTLFILGDDAYFVLGDNRGASIDSRAFGAVGRRAIIGVVVAAVPPWRDASRTRPVSPPRRVSPLP